MNQLEEVSHGINKRSRSRQDGRLPTPAHPTGMPLATDCATANNSEDTHSSDTSTDESESTIPQNINWNSSSRDGQMAQPIIPVHQPRAGPSAFVDGVDANFLLLDIPFDKFGTLLGFIPSLEFIPERLVKRCRRAYTFVMEHLLNNKNNGEAALVWWKKFLLLPFVLFSPSKKSEINRRLGLVLDNQWPFKLSDFDMQKQRFHYGNLYTEDTASDNQHVLG